MAIIILNMFLYIFLFSFVSASSFLLFIHLYFSLVLFSLVYLFILQFTDQCRRYESTVHQIGGILTVDSA